MRLAPQILVLVSLFFALTACETPTSPGTKSTREPGFISLERTTNGAGVPVGPVYVVTLFEDGRVLFEGTASVKSKGTFTRNITAAETARIFRQMDNIELWNRQRRYDVERRQSGGDSVIVRSASNEVPWDILRARDRGRSIRIDGLFFAPPELLDLKVLVEKTTGLAEWIGPPEEWKK